MKAPLNTTIYQSEDLSLYGLFSLFIRNWLILIICSGSTAVIALVWAIQQPNIYRAETVLMSVSEDQGGLGALAGSLGGLASMAGIGMPESGNDNTKLALKLLTSRAFIGKFIEKNDLLLPIMAADGWDMKTGELTYNNKIYDMTSNKWIRKVKPPLKPKPSLQEAFDVFSRMLSVEQEGKTKFINMSLEFYSPDIAAKWLQKLVILINQTIRELDIEEADKSIKYLEQLIVESSISGLQNIFSGLMEEQIKSKMLAQVREDYVFKVVDPAVAPERKAKPQRALIIIIAGFLGGILGLMIVLYRSGKEAYLNKEQ